VPAVFNLKSFLHPGENSITITVANWNGTGGLNMGVTLEFQEKPIEPAWQRGGFNGLARANPRAIHKGPRHHPTDRPRGRFVPNDRARAITALPAAPGRAVKNLFWPRNTGTKTTAELGKVLESGAEATSSPDAGATAGDPHISRSVWIAACSRFSEPPVASHAFNN